LNESEEGENSRKPTKYANNKNTYSTRNRYSLFSIINDNYSKHFVSTSLNHNIVVDEHLRIGAILTLKKYTMEKPFINRKIPDQ
jgi:hypothetical protein